MLVNLSSVFSFAVEEKGNKIILSICGYWIEKEEEIIDNFSVKIKQFGLRAGLWTGCLNYCIVVF